MADPGVSAAHVASTLRQLEAMAEKFDAAAGESPEDDELMSEMLETLRLTLSELEVSSEELQAQNAELHAARQLVERERQRYQDLFDLAPEPYLITDPDGIVISANEQAGKLLGRPSSRLQGKPLAVFVHRDSTSDFRRVLTWLRDGYGMHGWELQLQIDGDGVVVLATVEPVPGNEGDTELRWVLTDATSTLVARRRLNELLDAARRDASELRVMTEWQATLLGAAAHDLRSPLAAISDDLATALDHPCVQGEPDVRGALTTAASRVMAVRRLLPELLDLGRLQATNVVAQRGTVDLRDVVEQVCRILSVHRGRIATDFVVEDLVADKLQLERILENLLRNALRHTPDDQAVRVTSRPRGVDVLLTVDDAGSPVTGEFQETVFSPFTRVSRDGPGSERGGSNLGLSLVEMFAAMHGGRAWVESSDLGGASFRVLLSAALSDE